MTKRKADTKKAKAPTSNRAKTANKADAKRSTPPRGGVKIVKSPRGMKEETTTRLQEHNEPDAVTVPLTTAMVCSLGDAQMVPTESIKDMEDHNVKGSTTEPRDPRLPQVPTTLVRRNRQGVVQCECTVGPEGIFYNGRKFGSLSGAASAASKDLGLNPVVNGYVFFHLAKPARAKLGEVERLRRIGNRYEEQLSALILAGSGEQPGAALMEEIDAHERRLRKILSVIAP